MFPFFDHEDCPIGNVDPDGICRVCDRVHLHLHHFDPKEDPKFKLYFVLETPYYPKYNHKFLSNKCYFLVEDGICFFV